jgi:hypothetical protein
MLVGVIVVVHPHPEDLAGFRQALAVDRLPHPSGAVDRQVGRRICQQVEHGFGRRVDDGPYDQGFFSHANTDRQRRANSPKLCTDSLFGLELKR